jgi:glycosyltransferase involved in cell wall biosynthesis
MVPSYLGVFLEELANQVSFLYLFMHEANEQQKLQCDYILQHSNIIWVNLGLKAPAWHRTILHSKILKKCQEELNQCNVLLVRSPTPLAPFFYKYLFNTRLFFLVVGDYEAGANNMIIKSFREKAIKFFLLWSNKLFENQMKTTDVIVNSPALFEKYEKKSKSIFLIKTTTISLKDFYERKDTCNGPIINLLYTGSINPLKGLFELLEATAMLINQNYNIKCHFVGGELSILKPFEKELIEKAKQLKIIEAIVFHGGKTVGRELNEMYRMADIYVIPSYHEGFPRTIWEAMANGLPVVASRVGAIPYYLTENETVKLVPPKNSHEVYIAIKSIIDDSVLRKKLIQKGQQLAKEAVQETQIKLLVERIKTVPL